ncbi:MAG: FtsX-like permease family protein, partial [Candidatus Limnocylindrales bacterium]
SAFELVVSGTPGAAALPTALFGPAVEPVPILVSDALAAKPDGVKVGDTITVRVQGYPFTATAVGTIGAFPGLADDELFILANRDQLRQLAPTAPLQATVAYLRAPPGGTSQIQAAVTAAMPSGVVTSRAELEDGLRGAPVVAAIRLSIAATAAVAGLYAALAVAAALALAGSARAIELAHLRTLGLRNGQASGILLVEHLPAIVVAFAAGLALGVGLFTALASSLGLDALVGATIEIGPSLEPSLLAVTAGGVIAVVALGLGLGILLGRRASPVAAIRRGFE